MKIRNYRREDAGKIDEIYQRCGLNHNLPDISKCLGIAVVENDDGQIIALGALQLIPEAIMVLDHNRPKREQVEALKELDRASILTAKLNCYDEYYAFPDSDSYAGVLKKHFGYEDGNHILIKRIDDGEQAG